MRYVALLRGINVGGKNKVPMADLRALFEAAGHAGVRTYINSGNVIFDGPRSRAAELSGDLEARIAGAFGVSLRVLVLPGSTVVGIARALPEAWLRDEHSSCNVLYLLPEHASPEVLERFAPDPAHEELRYHAGALLSRVDHSHLGRSVFHKLVGSDFAAAVTIRNANTARRLAAMVEEG